MGRWKDGDTMYHPNRKVIHQFLVEVVVDPDDPKLVNLEDVRLRISDGAQWMDGVITVDARYCGQLPMEMHDA